MRESDWRAWQDTDNNLWELALVALVATEKENDTTLKMISSNGLRKRWNERSVRKWRISNVAKTCYIRSSFEFPKKSSYDIGAWRRNKQKKTRRNEREKNHVYTRQTFKFEPFFDILFGKNDYNEDKFWQ